MEAILSVIITSLIGIVLSYHIYGWGGKYKQIGIDMFRGIIGADICYAMLVLMIGLAPLH